ncbi:MAG: PepSY-associated TM helix domain-containing protein, partial [Pirellula sp.]
GTMYLFKPQFEAWSERAHDALAPPDKHRLLSEQVQAVLIGIPDAKTVQVELPRVETGATRVIVKDNLGTWRIMVHPQWLTILEVKNENESLMKQVKSLHGQLGIGTWGSYLVEIAACWTIVMILTGLVLWWPKNAKGLGGVLYPRWGKGDRVWWRDIHSVLGFWIC